MSNFTWHSRYVSLQLFTQQQQTSVCVWCCVAEHNFVGHLDSADGLAPVLSFPIECPAVIWILFIWIRCVCVWLSRPCCIRRQWSELAVFHGSSTIFIRLLFLDIALRPSI
jgi:hypothetical protein